MKLECDVVKDLYVLYKENELSPKVKTAVEEHLQQCNSCAQVYENEEGFEDSFDSHEIEVKPSEEFDYKMKFRIRLRRWRMTAFLIAVVLLIYSYFEYVDDRKNILYAVQSELNNVNQISLSIDSVKSNRDDFGFIFQELNQVQEKSGVIIRELNYFENRAISNHPNGMFISFQLVDFLEHLNIRYKNNVWTEKDEKALQIMKNYLEESLRMLEQERNKLSGLRDKLNISALIDPIDVNAIADLNQKINELSNIYTNFGVFPDEVEVLSNKEIVEKLSNIFDVSYEKIEFVEYANKNIKSMGEYRFEIKDKDYHLYGTINAITGELIEVNNSIYDVEGELLSSLETRQKLDEFLNSIYGDEQKFEIKELGINYRYSSNKDLKLYTFEIHPQLEGYILNNLYRVYIDGRTGRLKSFNKLEGYSLKESFKKSEAIINLDPEEALDKLKGEIENIEDYIYEDTIFIRSILSREYQLVHRYNDSNNHRKIYINTNTGKEEFPY